MIDRDKAFDILTSTFPELRSRWTNYIQEYSDYASDRIDYVDIGQIIDFVVEKVKSGNQDGLTNFFDQVEAILSNGDDYTKELIVIGLLEGIQNVSGWDKVDYHKGFDQWLKPKTKEAWDQLIHFWESDESKEKWDKIKDSGS